MGKVRPIQKPDVSGTPVRAKLYAILSQAMMKTSAIVVITDTEGVFEYVNRKFSSITGYQPDEVIGKPSSLLKSELMPDACFRNLWRRLKAGKEWQGEFQNQRKDGKYYWEQASISPIVDDTGEIRHFLKIAEDITQRKRLEDALQKSVADLEKTCRELTSLTDALKRSRNKMKRLAQEDALTGLLNRRGFDIALRRARALAERQNQKLGVLIIDIDHFKLINDRYGHEMGDYVLKTFAALLQSLLRASDLICRSGGDEVVIVLPAATAATTRATGQRILTAVRQQTFTRTGMSVAVTVSIGASCMLPRHDLPIDDLFRQADRALYRIKKTSRNNMSFAESSAPPLMVRHPSSLYDIQTPEEEQAAQDLPELLLAMLDAREHSSGAHCRRVAYIASVLARTLRLSTPQTALITKSALLHDIGKLSVPRDLLMKPGPLTSPERETIQHHTRAGHKILRTCPGMEAFSEIVLTHHERLDGSGYPFGLKGREISLGARILAVADTYDVIRAGRPYAEKRSAAEALKELRLYQGRLFDRRVVNALARCQDEIEQGCEALYPPDN